MDRDCYNYVWVCCGDLMDGYQVIIHGPPVDGSRVYVNICNCGNGDDYAASLLDYSYLGPPCSSNYDAVTHAASIIDTPQETVTKLLSLIRNLPLRRWYQAPETEIMSFFVL